VRYARASVQYLKQRVISSIYWEGLRVLCTIQSTRRSVLSDIKREAQPSVLYLIKHDYKCFKWLKGDMTRIFLLSHLKE
jgi:hypothetical protein